MPSFVSAGCDVRLRRLFPLGSTISPSANVTRGAGQGSTCGRATTMKLATSVVANREEVMRDRGWRCGGGMISRRGVRLIAG